MTIRPNLVVIDQTQETYDWSANLWEKEKEKRENINKILKQKDLFV
jgi:hypothetical protein